MKIFAHRGASKEAPENTLQAFRKALEIGVDGIEIDCLLTKDRVPVATHYDDLRILKLCEGFVRHKPWNEIQTLSIPTLTEVLELAKSYKCQVILDIKSQKGLMQKSPYIIAGLAQEILAPERILLTSFYWHHLLHLKKHFRHLPRGLILYQSAFRLVPIQIFDKLFHLRTIHPWLKWTTPALAQNWQAKGFQVHTWVANTEEHRYQPRRTIDAHQRYVRFRPTVIRAHMIIKVDG